MADTEQDKAKDQPKRPDPKTGNGAILPAKDKHFKDMKKKA